jgi:hypothetical protein
MSNIALRSKIDLQLSEVKINNACETIRENIKISAKMGLAYHELKKHKPWFNEGCLKLLDQKKQSKLQWL